MASKPRDVSAFLAKLWRLEALLLRAGLPPMPAWWRREIERFYRSGKRRWVIRKGRRVFASTCVAPRLAVAEMLYGQHPHIPGTPPLVYAFLSVKKAEAGKRLIGVKAILDVLGEKYSEVGDTIELKSRPAVFAVVTANFRTNVGDTVAFAWLDELARWIDSDLSANPAEQVVASLAPALATLPDAKLVMVSTPLGTDDYHARTFDLGETDQQCVSFGTTWDINPTLTREACESIEPDKKLRDREYGGIPQHAVSGAFEPEHWLRCFRRVPAGCAWHEPLGVLDSAAGRSARSDNMAWGALAYAMPPIPPEYLTGLVPRLVATLDPETGAPIVSQSTDELVEGVLVDDAGVPRVNPEARRPRVPLLVMTHIDSISGVFQSGLVSGELWNRIGRFYRDIGVRTVVGDQYGEPQSKKELAPWNVRFEGLTWPNDAKVRAVYRLRQLMADGALALPEHDKLRSEGLSFTERILPTGAIQYSGRGSSKDDHIALLLNAVMAEELRLLPGSDLYAPNNRHQVPGR